MATKKPKRDKVSDAEDEIAKKVKRKQLEVESLANIYRPKTLDDLVGQDHVVAQFRGMLKQGRIPPVFMIVGESGIGKTTVSRILARYVNCTSPDPKTFDPCGECVNCRYGENHPDFMELNAANQRGIDDMRSLVEQARNKPTIGKFKIILLDEAHRMTSAAFPVFLKPLEDPPKNTIWIWATTNPEQIPDTIFGRCHQFKLKKIEPEVIIKRLARIGRKEGMDFKEIENGKKILETIAPFSNGHMRNAIQMLDSAMSAYKVVGDKMNVKDFISTYMGNDEANQEKQAVEMVAAVLSGKMQRLVKAIRANDAQPRSLLYKARFLVQYLIDQYGGVAKFTPYSGKLFAAVQKETNFTVKITDLLQLQYRLCETEIRMNSVSMDESILLLSSLGSLIEGKKN